MSFSPSGGADGTPSNPSARFEGLLRGGERRERKERDGEKRHRNKFMVTD